MGNAGSCSCRGYQRNLKVELPCNGFLKITTATITISPLSQYHRYHNITTITISLLSQFHQYPNITTIATTIITITIITHITTITISPPSQSPLWQPPLSRKSPTNASFSHLQLSLFEGCLARKLCFHIFNFHFWRDVSHESFVFAVSTAIDKFTVFGHCYAGKWLENKLPLHFPVEKSKPIL